MPSLHHLTLQCPVLLGRRNQYDGQWEYYVTVRETAVHSQTHEVTEEQKQAQKVSLAQLVLPPAVPETIHCILGCETSAVQA